MTSSNENTKRTLPLILLITLILLPQINENTFFIAATIFHILLCKKIINIIPKKYKATKSLCFIGLLGLLPLSTNGINGLSNGVIGAMQEYTSIPLVYQAIWEEIVNIPSAITKRDIDMFTPHLLLLGSAGLLATIKLLLDTMKIRKKL